MSQFFTSIAKSLNLSLEKAKRTGIYIDNTDNRLKNRVGQKYKKELQSKFHNVVVKEDSHVIEEGSEKKASEIVLTAQEKIEYQDLFKTAKTIRPQYSNEFTYVKEQDPKLTSLLDNYWNTFLPKKHFSKADNLFLVNKMTDHLKGILADYDKEKQSGNNGAFLYMYNKYATRIRDVLAKTSNIQNKAKEVATLAFKASQENVARERSLDQIETGERKLKAKRHNKNLWKERQKELDEALHGVASSEERDMIRRAHNDQWRNLDDPRKYEGD